MPVGPAEVDITIYRGVARLLVFGPIKDEDDDVVDVAGWQGTLTLRSSATAPDPPAFTKAGAPYGTTTNGYMSVQLTETETLLIAAKKYEYSFVRSNAGFKDLISIGKCTVKYDILDPK